MILSSVFSRKKVLDKTWHKTWYEIYNNEHLAIVKSFKFGTTTLKMVGLKSSITKISINFNYCQSKINGAINTLLHFAKEAKANISDLKLSNPTKINLLSPKESLTNSPLLLYQVFIYETFTYISF